MALPAAAGRGGLVAGLSAAANRRGLLHRQTVAATAFAGLAALVMVAAAVARWVLAAEDPAAAASLEGWLGLVDLGAPRGATDDRSPGAVARRLAAAPAAVALVAWLAGTVAGCGCPSMLSRGDRAVRRQDITVPI